MKGEVVDRESRRGGYIHGGTSKVVFFFSPRGANYNVVYVALQVVFFFPYSICSMHHVRKFV